MQSIHRPRRRTADECRPTSMAVSPEGAYTKSRQGVLTKMLSVQGGMDATRFGLRQQKDSLLHRLLDTHWHPPSNDPSEQARQSRTSGGGGGGAHLGFGMLRLGSKSLLPVVSASLTIQISAMKMKGAMIVRAAVACQLRDATSAAAQPPQLKGSGCGASGAGAHHHQAQTAQMRSDYQHSGKIQQGAPVSQ